MAKIGAVTRIESMKACKCVQCGEWFYYSRITSKFCSDACRQQHKRQVEPTDKYKNDLWNEDERLLAMIAETNPQAFRKIHYVKEHYGQGALKRIVEIIRILGIA